MATVHWNRSSTAGRAIRSRTARLERRVLGRTVRSVRAARLADGANRRRRERATVRNRSPDSTLRTDGGSEQSGTDETATIEFLDRETVRIVGDLEETILSLFWWDESGRVGTITEPIGGVDGERTVTVAEAFPEQTFASGPVVTGVEGFTTPGPSVPGTGDVAASNPDLENHVEAVRDEYADAGELEDPFPDAS
ncbi:hypothetical protein [Halopiger xanaduensis]|uniref:Uncharacterized protein n=1 Tax=Halopiger xanaduensis (strain DSM 18323 / JCM 14033 / SH-6) TaxID=797210 RepID=F8D5B3_HALXS|nr:hypothetical protein [Halopiger xanaduensis]AEH37612.1 hypothetical protein Halxa_2996 [Halopiger xanaduensis SH-6]